MRHLLVRHGLPRHRRRRVHRVRDVPQRRARDGLLHRLHDQHLRRWLSTHRQRLFHLLRAMRARAGRWHETHACWSGGARRSRMVHAADARSAPRRAATPPPAPLTRPAALSPRATPATRCLAPAPPPSAPPAGACAALAPLGTRGVSLTPRVSSPACLLVRTCAATWAASPPGALGAPSRRASRATSSRTRARCAIPAGKTRARASAPALVAAPCCARCFADSCASIPLSLVPQQPGARQHVGDGRVRDWDVRGWV